MKSSSSLITTLKETETVSLHNMSNYADELHSAVHLVNDKYIKLIVEYLQFATESANNYSNCIILRGVDTITNVFSLILYYTKNIDLTYYQCQKSFYYFLEFVSQITEDQHIFLQLSSRDATTYVYKKTIYEISNETRKNIKKSSPGTEHKLKLINKFIEVNKLIIYNVITNRSKLVENVKKVSNRLNIEKIELEDLNTCLLFIELLIGTSKERLLDITLLYLKKVSKNLSLIKKSREKFYTEEFTEQKENDDEKFIFWLFS